MGLSRLAKPRLAVLIISSALPVSAGDVRAAADAPGAAAGGGAAEPGGHGGSPQDLQPAEPGR